MKKKRLLEIYGTRKFFLRKRFGAIDIVAEIYLFAPLGFKLRPRPPLFLWHFYTTCSVAWWIEKFICGVDCAAPTQRTTKMDKKSIPPSKNAVQSGAYSRDTLLPWESPEDYKQHRARIFAELQPDSDSEILKEIVAIMRTIDGFAKERAV